MDKKLFTVWMDADTRNELRALAEFIQSSDGETVRKLIHCVAKDLEAARNRRQEESLQQNDCVPA